MKRQVHILKSLAFAATAGCALFTAPARAELITFRADATVTNISGETRIFPFSASLGDTFSLYYTFEANATALPIDTRRPWELRYNAITDAFVRFEGSDYALRPVLGEVTVVNDRCESNPWTPTVCTDAYSANAGNWVFDPLVMRFNLTFSTSGETPQTALTSFALPGSALELAGLILRTGNLSFYDNVVTGQASLGFNVDAISAVPLPAAAWLFGSGLLAMGFRRRRAQPARVSLTAAADAMP